MSTTTTTNLPQPPKQRVVKIYLNEFEHQELLKLANDKDYNIDGLVLNMVIDYINNN